MLLSIETANISMKEIVITGTTCHVFADVVGAMLADGLALEALVDFPERVMISDTRLTIGHLPLGNYEKVRESFSGYSTAVLTYSDNLQDRYSNELTLRHFVDTVHAAREAGVERLIVVGSPDSQAFFVSDLRRLDDIDWVFISTEGNYPGRVVSEVKNPAFHSAVYSEA